MKLDKEKVIEGLEELYGFLFREYANIPAEESKIYYERTCAIRDALVLLKEQDEEHRRLLSWLGKFCRHIDNGDAWLTDEENIAFFKEKMKQQFGWDTD